MDIGNQQRVIIVEPDKVEAPQPEPMPAATGEEYDFVGEWPLPIAIEPELTPTN